MNNTQRLAAIDRLLSVIPSFQCKPGCADCCGPVMMSRLEMKRIVARTGIKEERLQAQWMIKSGCLDCPLLTTDNKCSVYDIRPAICRIFGSSTHARLRCPHGLGPEKPLTGAQTDSLVDECMKLGLGFANPLEKKAVDWLYAMGHWTKEAPPAS